MKLWFKKKNLSGIYFVSFYLANCQDNSSHYGTMFA